MPRVAGGSNSIPCRWVAKGKHMIEYANPDRIEVLAGLPGDKERYIKSDFLIRSGMCPNGHGLMTAGG